MRLMSNVLLQRSRGGRCARLGLGMAAAALAWLAPAWASAQSYQLHQWTNFEDGKLPTDCFPIGQFFDTRAKVVEIASVQGQGPGFYNDVAKKELGKYCIALNPEWPAGATGSQVIGFAAGVVLDRRVLGEKGRALFQADVYVPPTGQRVPNLSVLAMGPITGPVRSIVDFCRFGFTSDREVYFSYLPKGAATADLYKYSKPMLKQLPRDHWHRLAVLCQGPEQMRCFIDGIETPFSPFTETTMKDIQVGVLLYEKDKKVVAYADNLSIQFSPEDAPIPISPWVDSWPAELAATAGQEKATPTTQAAAPKASTATAAGASANGGAKKKPAAEGKTPAPKAVATAVAELNDPLEAPATTGASEAAGAGSNTGAAGASRPSLPFVARAAAAQRKIEPVGGSVKWLDTTEGWNQSSSSGRPMLVAFLAPNLPACQKFAELAASPAAAGTLSQYVPILIDVNQLQGGDLARKFGVFKVPSLVVLDSKGTVQSRVMVDTKDDWSAIAGKLSGK